MPANGSGVAHPVGAGMVGPSPTGPTTPTFFAAPEMIVGKRIPLGSFSGYSDFAGKIRCSNPTGSVPLRARDGTKGPTPWMIPDR